MKAPARIGARFQAVGDLADGEVAVLQLLLVDIGVVDTVDVQRPQRIIVRNFIRLIMLCPSASKKSMSTIVAPVATIASTMFGLHQLRVKVHAAAAEVEPATTRMTEQEGSSSVLVVDGRRTREVAAGEAHLAHRIDDRTGIERGDVDMLDRLESSSALRVSLIRSVSWTLFSVSASISCSIASSSPRKRGPGCWLR